MDWECSVRKGRPISCRSLRDRVLLSFILLAALRKNSPNSNNDNEIKIWQLINIPRMSIKINICTNTTKRMEPE